MRPPTPTPTDKTAKNMQEEDLLRCLQVAREGEKYRGSGGAVLFSADSKDAAYLLVDEFQPKDFADSLRDSLTEDGSEYFFVVVKHEQQLHVTKVHKTSAP